MDNIMVNGATAQDVTRILEGFRNVGVDVVAANKTDDSLVITVGNAGAEKNSFSVTFAPDISAPKTGATASADTMQTLASKLEGQAEASANAAVQKKSTATAQVSSFTDIFATLLLLLKAIQQQRQTASQVKLSQNLNERQQLQNEATQIRSAGEKSALSARNQFITQCVMFGVGACVTAVSTTLNLKGMTESGVKGARTDLNAAKADLKEVTGLKTGDAIELNAPKVDMAQMKSAQAPVAGAKVKVEAATEAKTAADNAVSQKQGELTQAKGLYEEALKADPKCAEVKTQELKAKYETAQKQLGEAQTAQEKAETTLDNAKAALGEKLVEMKRAIDTDVKGFETQLAEAQKSGDATAIKTAQDNLDAAKTTREVWCGKNKAGMLDGVKSQMKICRKAYDAAALQFSQGPRAKEAMIYEGVGNAAQMAGGAAITQIKGRGTQEEAYETAKQKQSAATAKTAEQNANMAEDLDKASSDLIRSVLDLLKSIAQSESQFVQSTLQRI